MGSKDTLKGFKKEVVIVSKLQKHSACNMGIDEPITEITVTERLGMDEKTILGLQCL